MTAETKTPLTDAAVVTGNGVYAKLADGTRQVKFETIKEWVTADHARTLELSLAAKEAECARLREDRRLAMEECAQIAANLVRLGDPGEIEETIRRAAIDAARREGT